MKKYELHLYIDGEKELYISTQDPIDIVEMIDHWGNFPRFLKKKKEDEKLPKSCSHCKFYNDFDNAAFECKKGLGFIIRGKERYSQILEDCPLLKESANGGK